MAGFVPPTSLQTNGPLPPSPEFLAETIGPHLIAASCVFIVLSTAFVALRYWARYLTHTKFGIEDVLIPFAWLAEVGLCITGIVMVETAGTGRHLAYVVTQDESMIIEHFKGTMLCEILHFPAVAIPKLCVVILYLRIFTEKWARRATWMLIYVIGATWLSYTIATMFQCVPFAFNWNKNIPGGRCFNVKAFATSSSVPNIVTDVAVLVLPVKTIMELKISKGRRWGLMCIFLTGGIGIVASIARTVVFGRVDPLDDPTFKTVELITWTIVEPGLYLFAACALSFKPLFRMVARGLHLDRLVTSTRTTYAGRKTGKGRTIGVPASDDGGIQCDTPESSHQEFRQLEPLKGLGDGDLEMGWKEGDDEVSTIAETDTTSDKDVRVDRVRFEDSGELRDEKMVV
ncbi:hypothetical protein BU24DRAFT_170900 [Aaosphaeria arxii CBS 175.79]|uniref:Rhodopsin domain-containing protein n=1 Tax=Aaosphaeria arxii CBS 175.79 TaxID=1450172 RepID=A0A6A5XYR1_9PLEO|nr:uncharacterized protein BU24DRAFT_170900 [Aaosphaeria arxii CBS 175.79]KAF2018438.1 hypothetical protein BU24DRAFT_170900 [Aaosphaeria arxii CBS 175.79]